MRLYFGTFCENTYENLYWWNPILECVERTQECKNGTHELFETGFSLKDLRNKKDFVYIGKL